MTESGRSGSATAVAAADRGGSAAGEPTPKAPRTRRLPRPSWRVLAAGAAGVGVVAVGLGLTSMQSPMAIGAITIEGAGPVLKPAVAAAIPVAAGESFRAVDRAALEEQIRSLEGVESASVEWAWWNELSVVVVEQTPAGAVAGPGGYTVLSATGDTIRRMAKRPPGLPLIEAPGAEARQVALQTAQALPPGLRKKTGAVIVVRGGGVQLRLAGGAIADIGPTTELAEKFAVLEQLLPIGAQRYNLVVPERPAVQGIPAPAQQ